MLHQLLFMPLKPRADKPANQPPQIECTEKRRFARHIAQPLPTTQTPKRRIRPNPFPKRRCRRNNGHHLGHTAQVWRNTALPTLSSQQMGRSFLQTKANNQAWAQALKDAEHTAANR